MKRMKIDNGRDARARTPATHHQRIFESDPEHPCNVRSGIRTEVVYVMREA